MYSVARDGLPHLPKNTTTVMYSLVRAAEDRRDASLVRVVVYLTLHSPRLSCVTSRIVANVFYSFHHKMDGEYVAQTMKGQKDQHIYKSSPPRRCYQTRLTSLSSFPIPDFASTNYL